MSTSTIEKNVLHIPDHTGDTRIMWDPRDEDEIDAARAAFNAAKARGMVAYAVGEGGNPNTGEVIRDFDPAKGKIIMMKQLVGG